jgi:hypothetical protein
LISDTIYEGDFSQGLKNGKGKLIFPWGDIYEGGFVDDSM